MLTPEQLYRTYPPYEELLKIKQRVDPEGLFTSDLARRVGISSTLFPHRPAEAGAREERVAEPIAGRG